MAHVPLIIGRCCMLGASILALLAKPLPLTAGGQQSIVTDVTIPQSTWMTMAVDVSYDHPEPGDTLSLVVRWRRLNGERLDFVPVTTRIGPGRGQVRLDTKYRGMLPPPSRIILHLELTASNGQRVLTRDCALSLVNARGKPAWAADLMRRRSGELSWMVRYCR